VALLGVVAFHHPGSPAEGEKAAAGLLKALPGFFGFRRESSRENGPWPDPGSTARSDSNNTALRVRFGHWHSR
jgi:hypothetical protein